jgi:hypothetical protein
VSAHCFGEYFLSEQITGRALNIAENTADKGVKVEILRWPG